MRCPAGVQCVSQCSSRHVGGAAIAGIGGLSEAEVGSAELKRGTKFDEAMIAGYKAILCAPDFLMVGLESGVPQRAKLGDFALAERVAEIDGRAVFRGLGIHGRTAVGGIRRRGMSHFWV